MDPATVSSALSALSAAGPLAVVLGFACGTLWRKLEALQRCKAPETAPCGVCMLCDRKAKNKHHADRLASLSATHAETVRSVSDSVAILASKVEQQEAQHAAEISQERAKRDALQSELVALLQAARDTTTGGTHGSITPTPGA